MNIKLMEVYKLSPPDWYVGEVTEENLEDLNHFKGEKLHVRGDKVFINGRWRSLDRKLKGHPIYMTYVKFYYTWLKVFYGGDW